jgi:Tfp pilus assembly PilM family ATPase
LDTPLIDRRSQAVMALQNYLRTSDFPTKKAVTSVSGNSVIVRYVKMAKTSPAELAQSIKFEAEPYIPFNIDHIVPLKFNSYSRLYYKRLSQGHINITLDSIWGICFSPYS